MLTKTGMMLAAAAVALTAGTTGASAQGRYYYGDDCHDQNRTAGTVLGAIAGGVIGNQFGRGGGRAAATVGGVILGGAIGNKIAGDMDCQDRQYAFRVYDEGLDGPIGRRYDWRDPRGHYGYFIPTREYRHHRRWCRDFEVGVWRHGRWNVNYGTACQYGDGWHFV
ncbi:MAG: glycine zipper 2TM domain-containing protein [Rhizomicrobium sp.]